MENQTPKKRVKIMKGIIKNAPKGSILTLEDNHRYYNQTGKTSFSEVTINDLGESIVQPLSADGLTKNDFRNRPYNDKEYFQKWNGKGWFDVSSYNSETLHLYRLKPQPKYIDVPDCVKLYLDLELTEQPPMIRNKERVLFLSMDDNLPMICGVSDSDILTPHHIDPTPLTELEDGQIYFDSYDHNFDHLDCIDEYSVWCEKENKMYYFGNTTSFRLGCNSITLLKNYRKVTPK